MKNRRIYRYIVVSVSRHSGSERRVAGFEETKDREAKRKFKIWFPEGNGYLKYKLYKLIDTAAGK